MENDHRFIAVFEDLIIKSPIYLTSFLLLRKWNVPFNSPESAASEHFFFLELSVALCPAKDCRL